MKWYLTSLHSGWDIDTGFCTIIYRRKWFYMLRFCVSIVQLFCQEGFIGFIFSLRVHDSTSSKELLSSSFIIFLGLVKNFIPVLVHFLHFWIVLCYGLIVTCISFYMNYLSYYWEKNNFFLFNWKTFMY